MRIRSLLAVSLFFAAACNLGSESDNPDARAQGVGGEGSVTETPAPAASASGTTPAPAAEAPAAPAAETGAVFTMSNASDKNEVLAFTRNADGTLAAAGTFDTGGKGTAKGLGSQGAVVLTADGRYLLVANAGSNDISSFAVDGTKLTLIGRASSGGTQPVSITIRGDLVYALNAGDETAPSCISGLRMDAKGNLTNIAGSTHSLSTAGAVAPAQVSFTPSGSALIVTEKATDVIDTFVVKGDGTTSNGQALPSAGKTPFGFSFTSRGQLVVSEAFGGMPLLGAVSSYDITGQGQAERSLSPISLSVPDNGSAPCWVVLTNDSRWAFASNTGSSSISAYDVAASGALTLQGDGIAAPTGQGSKPLDLAMDRATKHLYVLNGGTNNVMSFTVASNGALAPLGQALPVPATSFGLAAR